ncbi:MAG TPA: signal peptidase I [Gaiellaceae bacterium]
MRTPLARLPRPWRTVADWVITIGLAFGFVLVFEAEIAKPYRIPSASMEPTLHCARPAIGCQARFSDRVLAARIVYRLRSPERGDIVVFKTPPRTAQVCSAREGDTFVKRLIGLPGDTVSERNGYVYVNGRRLDEPYIATKDRDRRTETWARLAPGRYFMMRDDRSLSCDSRDWGPVPRGNLIGPVVVTYWPPTRLAVR